MTKVALLFRTAAILLGAAGIYWFCVLPVRCAHVIRRVEASTERAFDKMPEWMTARVARRNLQILASVPPRACNDVDYPLLLAANSALLQRREEAVRHFDEALRLDNRPEVYFNRGSALLALGRIDEAVRDFAVAVDFDHDLLTQIDGEVRGRVAKQLAETNERRERARLARQPPGGSAPNAAPHNK